MVDQPIVNIDCHCLQVRKQTLFKIKLDMRFPLVILAITSAVHALPIPRLDHANVIKREECQSCRDTTPLVKDHHHIKVVGIVKRDDAKDPPEHEVCDFENAEKPALTERNHEEGHDEEEPEFMERDVEEGNESALMERNDEDLDGEEADLLERSDDPEEEHPDVFLPDLMEREAQF